MHRMKGVEFRCVAVIDLDDDTVPLRWAVTPQHADPVQHTADLQRERCTAYVAATRAREDLWIGRSGRPSRFLELRGEESH
jgi:superfamily I DNA/RNA helicase